LPIGKIRHVSSRVKKWLLNLNLLFPVFHGFSKPPSGIGKMHRKNDLTREKLITTRFDVNSKNLSMKVSLNGKREEFWFSVALAHSHKFTE